MDHLQYDSFYKFLVSAGVILITGPLFGIYFLLFNGNQILLSQAEYDALSETSTQFIIQRDKTILYAFRILPWVLAALMLIGVVCLVWGSIHWHKTQKELDAQTKLKTKEQQLNIEKLSTSEVVEKAIEEVVSESNETNGSTAYDKLMSLKNNSLVKAIQIEELCFSFVKRKYSPKEYTIRQNVKIGDKAFDLIATSKLDNIDYIYEIKYWDNVPSKAKISQVIRRLIANGIYYENAARRNFRCVLLIVATDEAFTSIKSLNFEYAKNQGIPVDVNVISEKDLT